MADRASIALDGLSAQEAAREGRQLIAEGRLAEAEALLENAIARLGDHEELLHLLADQAMHRAAWPQAAARWNRLRAAFPTNAFGWAMGAFSLLLGGELDAAEQLAVQTLERFPGDRGASTAWAEVAMRRHDWPEAARRWAALRAIDPDMLQSYIDGARALRAAGSLEACEDLLREAGTRLHDSPEPWRALASMAQDRQDWPVAAARWNDGIARFPDQIDFYSRGRHAAQQAGQTALADSIAAAAAARFPDRSQFLVELAREALNAGRFAEAAGHAAVLRERFPDETEGYLIGAEAIEGLQDPAGAQAIIAGAEARMPGRPVFALVQARQALRAHRWSDAEHWFTELRIRAPQSRDGWIGGVEALREQGRFADAVALIEAGMAALPDDLELVLAHVEAPLVSPYGRTRDFEPALERSRLLCERAPGYEPGLVQRLRLLLEAGQYDAAEAHAATGIAALPGSGMLASEHANIAVRREDWHEALNRFTQLRERFPDWAAGPVGVARVLARLERFDEAEAELRAAMKRFPNELDTFAEYARVAIRRGAPGEAFRRWQDARARFPQVPWLATAAFEAQLQMAEADEAAPAADAAAEPAALGSIMLDFESLGGTWLGCEFGLVQRAARVEPLGLLRWTEMTYEALVALLEADLAGIGEPENTELLIPDAETGGEYSTCDRRFFMRMHTFVDLRDVPPERMFKQVCRRLKYLRDKLIEDLRLGAKVFVFKQSTRNLTVAEFERVHDGLCRLGPNTLFYVRTADEAHPNGTVVWHRPGLLVGYIERFALGPEQENNGAQTQSWNALCLAAHAMWKAGRDGA